MKLLMFNGYLFFMLFVWTSAKLELGSKRTKELQLQEYDHESRLEIQARRKACRNLGGKCIKKKRDCPNNRPLKTPPGRPYCSKRRHCCYPAPPTELPILVTGLTIPELTEKLMAYDHNSVFSKLTITPDQTKLLSGASDILDSDTYRTLQNLQLKGDYKPDVNKEETITDSRKVLQKEFLDAILKTDVMKITEKFLIDKGKISDTEDLRSKLIEMWFSLYSRANNKVTKGSSGFEHVFLGETRGNGFIGFHNWVFFFHEQDNPTPPNLEYKGFTDVLQLASKGKILGIKIKWLKEKEKTSSMFIGSSPELEMAVYTICFLLEPDTCSVSMAQQKFTIKTFKFKEDDFVASAYPVIPT